ncbi:unnamed protein product [Paramecium pentaurelia]|uniref:LITAF domain-containing protein n=1 Tax=Paramecium pentaurelia TaxID=43138 RepID=A0A8S1RUZ0_9CILI|nr:unnamed protein product [Paramecium pentaurelia]
MYQNVIQGIPVCMDQNSTFYSKKNICDYENQVIVNKQLPQWANNQEKQTEIQCQFCKRPIITITKQRIGKGSLVCSFILILTFPVLFWLPCYKESCQDVVHLCPNCSHLVGEKLYKPCS